MTFEDRREAALRLLNSKGIRRSTSAPPLFLLLWRWGVKIAPPHFRSLPANALLSGSNFGLLWWLIMWPIQWLHNDTPVEATLLPTLLAALFFGLCMGLYYHVSARKHALPRWSEVQ
ncbi:hypothetical protein HSX11_25935 [Oxalobacteraceae bacterium]|nr:hypothetical protein [Oxalobacteraceae bacterium]